MKPGKELRTHVFCREVSYVEEGVVQALMANDRLQIVMPLPMVQAERVLPGRAYRLVLSLVPVEEETP